MHTQRKGQLKTLRVGSHLQNGGHQGKRSRRKPNPPIPSSRLVASRIERNKFVLLKPLSLEIATETCKWSHPPPISMTKLQAEIPPHPGTPTPSSGLVNLRRSSQVISSSTPHSKHPHGSLEVLLCGSIIPQLSFCCASYRDLTSPLYLPVNPIHAIFLRKNLNITQYEKHLLCFCLIVLHLSQHQWHFTVLCVYRSVCTAE